MVEGKIYGDAQSTLWKFLFAVMNQILRKSGLYYDFFALVGVSIYLMNCSVSKLKCEKYHVTGYPTIIMFQMQSSYQFQKCLPHQLLTKPVQINYHGNFEVYWFPSKFCSLFSANNLLGWKFQFFFQYQKYEQLKMVNFC